MSSIQSYQRSGYAGRQRAWLVLVLCCFLLQALTPRGYMPATSTEGFPVLGFCGDPIPGLEQLLGIEAFPDTEPAHSDLAHEQIHCVFSVVAQVAAVVQPLSPPQAPRVLQLPSTNAVLAVASHLPYHLPDTRAPPVQTA